MSKELEWKKKKIEIELNDNKKLVDRPLAFSFREICY